MSRISGGDRITVSMLGSVPYRMLDALAPRLKEISGITISAGPLSRVPKIFGAEFEHKVRLESRFCNAPERQLSAMGEAVTYTPVHLSAYAHDVELTHKESVLMLMTTPPDENGFVSTGMCPTDRLEFEAAQLVIAQVNSEMPFVDGEGHKFSIDSIDFLVEANEPLNFVNAAEPTPEIEKIGGYIADMIEDGSCLQLGIGSIGRCIGKNLRVKRHLGIHTELLSESSVELIKCGAADNSLKKVCPGRTLFGYAQGPLEMLRWLDNNHGVIGAPFSYVNDARVIAQNDRVVSVNSAMEIDLTGQVCAEGIGFRHYSGSGGQLDFVRGARWSRGGKSFIAMPAVRTDKKGERHSKIELALPSGSPVTTPRTDVEYVVTEYGVVNLRGASIDERARRLISIAHPDFRERLFFEAKKARLII